jgi:hypothetical protein
LTVVDLRAAVADAGIGGLADGHAQLPAEPGARGRAGSGWIICPVEQAALRRTPGFGRRGSPDARRDLVPVYFGLSYVAVVAGFISFGISTFWAWVYPRWTGPVIAIGSVAAIVMAPLAFVPTGPFRLVRIGVLAASSAFAWCGWHLLRHPAAASSGPVPWPGGTGLAGLVSVMYPRLAAAPARTPEGVLAAAPATSMTLVCQRRRRSHHGP